MFTGRSLSYQPRFDFCIKASYFLQEVIAPCSTGSSSTTYDHDRYYNYTYVIVEMFNRKLLSHISKIRSEKLYFLKKIFHFTQSSQATIKYLFVARFYRVKKDV